MNGGMFAYTSIISSGSLSKAEPFFIPVAIEDVVAFVVAGGREDEPSSLVPSIWTPLLKVRAYPTYSAVHGRGQSSWRSRCGEMIFSSNEEGRAAPRLGDLFDKDGVQVDGPLAMRPKFRARNPGAV